MTTTHGHEAGGVVTLEVEVAAAPAAVWRAFTVPELTETWMGGFRMTSTWQVGAPVVLSGRLNGKNYRESGAVLAFQPAERLQFDHWSRLWRIPDGPGNRAVMTVQLEPAGDVTRVVMTHDLPDVTAIVPHARFFWTVALDQLRQRLDGA